MEEKADNLRIAVSIVVVISAICNILLLAGPIFLMQIYDDVIPSGSPETLVVFFAIVVLAHIFWGLFEYRRSMLNIRIGHYCATRKLRENFNNIMTGSIPLSAVGSENIVTSSRSIRQFWSSRAAAAIFDLPWSFIHLFILFKLHWTLGGVAVIALGTLLATSAVSHVSTSKRHNEYRWRHTSALNTWKTIGGNSAFSKQADWLNRASDWLKKNDEAECFGVSYNDGSARNSARLQTARMSIQSTCIGWSAWLVVSGELTTGALFASSLFLSKFLGPFEGVLSTIHIIKNLRQFSKGTLANNSREFEVSRWKARNGQAAKLSVSNVAVVAGENQMQILERVNFDVGAGEIVNVVGDAGEGKTLLAEAVSSGRGIADGEINIEVPFDNTVGGPNATSLKPQNVTLYAGTILQNIVGFEANPNKSQIEFSIESSCLAQCLTHSPRLLHTQVIDGGINFSSGQKQLIALARLFYQHPSILVIDGFFESLPVRQRTLIAAAIRRSVSQGAIALVFSSSPVQALNANKTYALKSGLLREAGRSLPPLNRPSLVQSAN